MADPARPTVLVVTDRDLGNRAKGNVRRILALLAQLRALACEVVLVTCVPPPRSVCDEVELVDGRPFTGGPVAGYDAGALSRRVAQLCLRRPVRAVVAEYAWLAPCLAVVPPGTLRIVDTHDVLYERDAELTGRGLDAWVACTPEEERALLSYADVLLAIQDRDAETLRELVGPAVEVVTVGHAAGVRPMPYRPSTGAGVLFVGSWHAGNLGIAGYATRSWPAVRAARPDAELLVYGSIGGRLGGGDGVRLAGVVDDWALAQAYAEAALVVAPVTAGGGLKIKVVEALHHGRAVVATPLSVRGMPEPRTAPWLLADDWPALTRATRALLTDDARRHRLERAALLYARKEYGVPRMRAALSAALASRGRPDPCPAGRR